MSKIVDTYGYDGRDSNPATQPNYEDNSQGMRVVKANKSLLPSHSRALKQLLLIVLALATGIGTTRVLGDDQPAPATPAPTPALAYQVKVLTAGTVEIGKAVLIGIYGTFASELKTAMNTDAETARKNLKLYLDGVPMEGLAPAVILPPEAAPDPNTSPKPEYVLRFVLKEIQITMRTGRLGTACSRN